MKESSFVGIYKGRVTLRIRITFPMETSEAKMQSFWCAWDMFI